MRGSHLLTSVQAFRRFLESGHGNLVTPDLSLSEVLCLTQTKLEDIRIVDMFPDSRRPQRHEGACVPALLVRERSTTNQRSSRETMDMALPNGTCIEPDLRPNSINIYSNFGVEPSNIDGFCAGRNLAAGHSLYRIHWSIAPNRFYVVSGPNIGLLDHSSNLEVQPSNIGWCDT
jgi:hypothetical protein